MIATRRLRALAIVNLLWQNVPCRALYSKESISTPQTPAKSPILVPLGNTKGAIGQCPRIIERRTMSDSLKSIVIFANALFLGCITIAAFLISPVDTAAPYSEALKELNDLSQLRTLARDYRKDVGERIERMQLPELIQGMMVDRGLPRNWDGILCAEAAPAASAPAVKEVPGPPNAETAPAPKAMKDQRKNHLELDASEGTHAALISRRISPTPDPIFTAQPSRETLHDQLVLADTDHLGPMTVALLQPQPEKIRFSGLAEGCLRSWNNSLPITTVQPQIDGTLAQIHEFFVSRPPLEDHSDPDSPVIFYPDVCYFTYSFRHLLTRHPDLIAVEWWIEAPPLQSGENERGTKVCKGCAGPASVSAAAPFAMLTVRFSQKDGNGEPVRECISVGGSWGWPKCGVAQPSSFKRWARDKELLPKLRVEIDSSFVWLPKSRAIWSEIKEKGLEEAVLTVTGRHERETNRISLFGLNLNRTSATYFFPVVLAILFFLIWTHAVHLCNTLPTERAEQAKLADGWFVLFPHHESKWLGVGLLAVFPNIVLSWLLIPDHGVHPLMKVIVAAIILALSIKSLLACLRLRQNLCAVVPVSTSVDRNDRELLD